MKNLLQLASMLPGAAVIATALSLSGLTAVADQPPQPAVAAPTPSEEDILDIRGPIPIPAPFPWGVWTAGALGCAGLFLGAWWLRRRSPLKQPHELALEDLDKLRALMQPENAGAFSLAVSEIVRRFIEHCFPVRAAHRTTGEFLQDLASLPDSPLAAHREQLRDFLGHCDLAKFARWSLTVPQMEAMLTSAGAFVAAIGHLGTAKEHRTRRKSAPARGAEPVAASA
jgi:hypothetical protein